VKVKAEDTEIGKFYKIGEAVYRKTHCRSPLGDIVFETITHPNSNYIASLTALDPVHSLTLIETEEDLLLELL
jgi:hypothetical protein